MATLTYVENSYQKSIKYIIQKIFSEKKQKPVLDRRHFAFIIFILLITVQSVLYRCNHRVSR